jgi:hypothetical protein
MLVHEDERRSLKREYERSFLSFVRRAFQEIDPAPLKLAPFHEVIIEHLEAVANGEIRSLILNCPPRTGKSLICSVLYPAFIWCRSEIGPQSGPQVSFFCVSYSTTLAEELAVKMRRLVFGHWYQGIWGDRVKMVIDQASRANFSNTRGGARISSSIESGLLGRGAECHLYDDLMTVKEADSDAERLSILRAFSEGLPTRLNHPATAARILIGQRVAEDDPTNLALETWEDAVHLMFPARYEVARCCPQDRRTVEGELLWPEVWPEEEIRKVELGLAGLEKGQAGLSSYAAQAQLQQSPVARGGGVIPRTAWKIWPENPLKPEDIKRNRNGEYMVELPQVSFVLVCVDTAFSEKDTADFSAVVVLGVWSRRREEVTRERPHFLTRWGNPVDIEAEAERLSSGEEQARVVVMEAFRTRAPLHDLTLDPRTQKPRGLCERILDVCRRRRADRLLVENANRGQDVIREIEREMRVHEFGLEQFQPSLHGSKLNRMWSVQPLIQAGLVYGPANLVRTLDEHGREQVDVREFAWFQEIVNECERTPRGKQDLADCISIGLLYLRNSNFISLTPEFVKEELAHRAWKPPAFNAGKHYGVVG